MAQTVKHLSINAGDLGLIPGLEDSLEKEMATHSSTLAKKIPWMEETGAGYCPWGRKESDMTELVIPVASYHILLVLKFYFKNLYPKHFLLLEFFCLLSFCFCFFLMFKNMSA